MRTTILPNGNLLLQADNATRRCIADEMRRGRRGNVLHELLEHEICNGSFTPFDAGDGNPFVGLSSAPCIAEAMITEDNGENVIDGRLWAFTDYMIRDELEELRNKGRVVFDLVEEEA